MGDSKTVTSMLQTWTHSREKPANDDSLCGKVQLIHSLIFLLVCRATSFPPHHDLQFAERRPQRNVPSPLHGQVLSGRESFAANAMHSQTLALFQAGVVRLAESESSTVP